MHVWATRRLPVYNDNMQRLPRTNTRDYVISAGDESKDHGLRFGRGWRDEANRRGLMRISLQNSEFCVRMCIRIWIRISRRKLQRAAVSAEGQRTLLDWMYTDARAFIVPNERVKAVGTARAYFRNLVMIFRESKALNASL